MTSLWCQCEIILSESGTWMASAHYSFEHLSIRASVPACIRSFNTNLLHVDLQDDLIRPNDTNHLPTPSLYNIHYKNNKNTTHNTTFCKTTITQTSQSSEAVFLVFFFTLFLELYFKFLLKYFNYRHHHKASQQRPRSRFRSIINNSEGTTSFETTQNPKTNQNSRIQDSIVFITRSV